MINKRVVYKRLDHLREIMGELAKIEVSSVEELENPANFQTRRALERCLFLAVQDVLDTGAHIISALSLGMPETYQSIIDTLGREGILPEEFARRIRGMAGFRNILEHEYVALDLGRLYEYFCRRGEFEEFARHIVVFLEGV